jgi:hypothetical protein
MTDEVDVEAEPTVLPRRSQVEPFVAYKVVSLNFKAGKVTIAGSWSEVDTDTVAECRAYPKPDPPHAAPDPDCTCGFWALSERPSMSSYSPILATVELFGTVIHGEKGYRANRQRITRIDIDPTCVMCDVVGDTRRGADALYAKFGGEITKLCAGHGSASAGINALERLEVDQVADILGIPVAWGLK